MGQNFIACDRERELLLPPILREWLPQDHLAWFVLDAVGAMDLRPFLAGYRDDGWGRAAHAPAMMVALLVYAYAVGERSSRAGSSPAAARTSRCAHHRQSGSGSHDDRRGPPAPRALTWRLVWR